LLRAHAAISISKEIPGIVGWLLHANRAPGTTHVCKGFLSEEINFAIRAIGAVIPISYSFQGQFADLLGQECTGLVDGRWCHQKAAKLRQPC
jgi:hypothetical protein